MSATACKSGDAVAICARNSIAYAAAFCGILAAGAAVALLAPSSTPASITMMLEDSGAKVFLLDGETARALKESGHEPEAKRVALDDGEAGEAFSQWIGPDGATPTRRFNSPRPALRHHLFLGDDRRAEGDRPAASDAMGAVHPGFLPGTR